MDARLSLRYERMVQSYMKVSEPLSAGMKALNDGVSSFAHTQAAWRFLCESDGEFVSAASAVNGSGS
ncbi:MAG: hypothetical protein IPL34_02120 [Thiofilum sp.]|uniref:hypothetical protein n=1 Tax=Thiofilum sp. TaxID=2212733 RepID=UPI0025F3AB08|nr:hypothetical protein [Thiofilum sp.]MBK8452111.1 hypothetical protein [Thiofilum sp.]